MRRHDPARLLVSGIKRRSALAGSKARNAVLWPALQRVAGPVRFLAFTGRPCPMLPTVTTAAAWPWPHGRGQSKARARAALAARGEVTKTAHCQPSGDTGAGPRCSHPSTCVSSVGGLREAVETPAPCRALYNAPGLGGAREPILDGRPAGCFSRHPEIAHVRVFLHQTHDTLRHPWPREYAFFPGKTPHFLPARASYHIALKPLGALGLRCILRGLIR